MKPRHHRSAKRTRLRFAAPALAGAAASVANADIVYTSINGGAGVTVGPTESLFFDLDGQTYHTGSFQTGDDFFFCFVSYDSSLPYAGAYYSNRVFSSGLYVTKFLSGDPIGGSYSGGAFMAFLGEGFWAPGDSGYVGLRFVPAGDALYGWAEVAYSGSDLTLQGFAYDTTGATINAGAVPEPGETALLGALAAGSAAAFAARRKRKLAKAA